MKKTFLAALCVIGFLLLTGERLDHHGEHYVVEDARIYTLPQAHVPVLVSGLGPKAIEGAAAGCGGWGLQPRRGGTT